MISIIKNKIDNIKLENIAILIKEKFNYSNSEVQNLIGEYRNWLIAKTLYPNLRLSPSTDIDEVWHLHLNDKQKYTEDCIINFGEVITHNTYKLTTENIVRAKSQFDMTKKVWIKLFGYELKGTAAVCD